MVFMVYNDSRCSSLPGCNWVMRIMGCSTRCFVGFRVRKKIFPAATDPADLTTGDIAFILSPGRWRSPLVETSPGSVPSHGPEWTWNAAPVAGRAYYPPAAGTLLLPAPWRKIFHPGSGGIGQAYSQRNRTRHLPGEYPHQHRSLCYSCFPYVQFASRRLLKKISRIPGFSHGRGFL